MRLTWRTVVACVLTVTFLTGMALLCGWRWGDLAGRWAYLGAAVSILSAIAFTVLTVTKADKVSEET